MSRQTNIAEGEFLNGHMGRNTCKSEAGRNYRSRKGRVENVLFQRSVGAPQGTKWHSGNWSLSLYLVVAALIRAKAQRLHDTVG